MQQVLFGISCFFLYISCGWGIKLIFFWADAYQRVVGALLVFVFGLNMFLLVDGVALSWDKGQRSLLCKNLEIFRGCWNRFLARF